MPNDRPLVILLNGPLGIGKTTLGEALGEAIEQCVTLDGDRLAALNPPPEDELASLHETLALLFGHHLKRGFSRFVISHYWSTPAQIGDLQRRLEAVTPSTEVRCFRLTLSKPENLRRIARRQSACAIDETEFEARHFAHEYAALSEADGAALGEPFDVSDSPATLVARMLELLGLPRPAAY